MNELALHMYHGWLRSNMFNYCTSTSLIKGFTRKKLLVTFIPELVCASTRANKTVAAFVADLFIIAHILKLQIFIDCWFCL